MNPHLFSVSLPNEAATLFCGQLLASVLQGKGLITLKGNLGGGKTTLCRGLIQAMGHKGAVKSPTYTLVEPYELNGQHVLHYDLYRLSDPEELEFLGVRDFLDENSLTLIEWPERAGNFLPTPDLALNLIVEGKGRVLSYQGNTERGQLLSSLLSELFSKAGYKPQAKLEKT